MELLFLAVFILMFVFIFLMYALVDMYKEKAKAKEILSLIGIATVIIILFIICSYFLVKEFDADVKANREEYMITENNIKTINNLISDDLKTPPKQLIISEEIDISGKLYYRVEASRGVYKYYFKYDKNEKIESIQEKVNVRD